MRARLAPLGTKWPCFMRAWLGVGRRGHLFRRGCRCGLCHLLRGRRLRLPLCARRGVVRSELAPAKSFPSVTILKPLHGAEPGLLANLAGFCVQDYPGPVQIVFGVEDRADPAIDIVSRLIAEFPDCDIELVVNSFSHGTNRKVSNLINLAAQARHDVLVLSDSDIIVDPDYLKN